MSYLVLARKCRPQTFESVLGQEHITRVLTNALKSSRLAHSFLFSGPRGVGKTSTARILAKALNCDKGPAPVPCNECPVCREITSGSSSCIIEIDGASNNSVDDIRSLREKVGMIPTTGRFKVYIIDEVHMLSQAAFNALLKTLEEPPAHVKFIFATTEIHKIPPTILSRCQRFDFKRISLNSIMDNVQLILDQESISTTPKVRLLIAKAADGSMRDALSILDQILSACGAEIVEADVEGILGLVGREKLESMAEAVACGDAGAALSQLHKVLSMGSSLESYWQQLMEYFRDGLMLRIAKEGVELTSEEIGSVENIFKSLSVEDMARILKNMAEGFDSLRSSRQPRVMAEMMLIKLCDRRPFVGLEKIVLQLKDLEKGLRNSVELSTPVSQPVRLTEAVSRQPVPSPNIPKPPPLADIPASAKPVPEKYIAVDAQPTPNVLKDSIDSKTLYKTLIQNVRSTKKSLAALLNSGEVLDFDKERVVLGFEKGIDKIINSQANIKILQSELGKILNHNVRVEISGENLKSASFSTNADKKKKKDMEEVESNPTFKIITEMFDARVVQIQKVD